MNAAQVLQLAQAVLPKLVDSQGNLNPAAALGELAATATVRTTLTPEVQVEVAELAQGGSSPPGLAAKLLVGLLRPTVVLEGGALGRTVWAPAGEAAPGHVGAVGLAVVATTLLGGAVLLGYGLGRAKGSNTP